jgi:heterodisulfide reductase subunit B
MKLSYYPGCSLEGGAKEYDESMRSIFKTLDIDLKELEDWNCCGASSGHVTDEYLALALPMRNLIIAEGMGLDLVVPCMACFNRLKHAEKDGPYHEDISKEFEYKGKIKILHTLDYLSQSEQIDHIGKEVKRPLEGLKVVPYYGCLYARPPKVTDVHDHEDPQSMDDILKALGADVQPWSFKTDCCGGNLALTKTDVLKKMTGRLFEMAQDADAEALVVACPMCHANLDTREREIAQEENKDYNMPIYYITELIGIAFGLQDVSKWLKRHLIDPAPLLKGKGLL